MSTNAPSCSVPSISKGTAQGLSRIPYIDQYRITSRPLVWLMITETEFIHQFACAAKVSVRWREARTRIQTSLTRPQRRAAVLQTSLLGLQAWGSAPCRAYLLLAERVFEEAIPAISRSGVELQPLDPTPHFFLSFFRKPKGSHMKNRSQRSSRYIGFIFGTEYGGSFIWVTFILWTIASKANVLINILEMVRTFFGHLNVNLEPHAFLFPVTGLNKFSGLMGWQWKFPGG